MRLRVGRCTALSAFFVCASVGPSSAQTSGGPVAGQPPIRAGKVVVMAMEDCKERGGDVATGSGLLTQSTLRDALVTRGFTPLSSDSRSLLDAVKEGGALSYDYVLRGKLTECEDNATAWSGKKDSVAVSVELYDLTPTLVSAASHRQRGSSFALTDSTPDRLLATAVANALTRLVGTRR